MKNILVIGGAGYIGSYMCKYLAKHGYNPVVLDNLIYGHRDAVKWGPFIEGSMADSNLLKQIFSKLQIAAVMHFAAFCYVGESVTDPGKYYRNNVANTLNLLEAMVEKNFSNFIFSSSCATYGEPSEIPITEEHPQNPINPYGRSKLMVEQILEDFKRAYGLEYVSLRYFNAAGADPEGEHGNFHTPSMFGYRSLESIVGRRKIGHSHPLHSRTIYAVGNDKDFEAFAHFRDDNGCRHSNRFENVQHRARRVPQGRDRFVLRYGIRALGVRPQKRQDHRRATVLGRRRFP